MGYYLPMTPLQIADELERELQNPHVSFVVIEAADLIRQQHLKIRELQMRLDQLTIHTQTGFEHT